MDFESRLERAIGRGRDAREAKTREVAEKALTTEELRALHTSLRVELSEHIDGCLRKLADHFPGFRFQTVVAEEGWGARISRDDVRVTRDRSRRNGYSRFEMLVKPFETGKVIELAAKGAVHNKETLNRTHYQMLSQADLDSFTELIDLWVLEYAEQYAAKT